MFDSVTLRPVIISMVLFMLIVKGLPNVLKEPTNIKTVDDVTMLAVTLDSFMMPGVILIGLLTFFTGYVNESL